jgi:hypothetical protein
VVICRLPNAAARVRAQVWSCEICGGQSGPEAGFLRVLRFPLPIFIPPIVPQSPSSINWGWYNRPIVAAVTSGLGLTALRIIIKKIWVYETSLAARKTWKRNVGNEVGEVLVSGRALSINVKAAGAVIVKRENGYGIFYLLILDSHEDLQQWFLSWSVPKFQISLWIQTTAQLMSIRYSGTQARRQTAVGCTGVKKCHVVTARPSACHLSQSSLLLL